VAIGNRFPEQHLVGASTDFRAGRDGPLALYVNDAVTPIPSWDALYKNNTGGAAQVKITRLASTGEPQKEFKFECPTLYPTSPVEP
jgi:hypothetical protein